MSNALTSRIEELGKIWIPEINWHIPSAKAVFTFPAFGPGNYNDDVRQVLASKQRLPTGEQTAFMLDEAYNSVSEEVKNSPRVNSVRNIMHNNWLWAPVVNIWTPNSVRNPGMYAVFDENGKGLAMEITTEELEDRLSRGSAERGLRFSKDRTVAFAPRNTYNEGEHKKGTLSQDGAFIANYGVEGAEKLNAVANVFSLKPYSRIVNNTSDKPFKTLSALNRSGFLGGRLLACFDSGGDSRAGYVLSVSGSENSAEGTLA